MLLKKLIKNIPKNINDIKVKGLAINSNKVKKQLKWKPRVKFKEGLKKTIEWYLNNKSYYSLLSKKDIIKRIGLKK